MKLNDDQLDVVTEVFNIGTGRAAAALSNLTDSRITLTVPSVSAWGAAEVEAAMNARDTEFGTIIRQGFAGDVSGRAVLAFPKQNALRLAHIVGGTDDDHDELDFEEEVVLEEIGNIVLNGILGTVGNIMDAALNYTLPELYTDSMVSKVIAAGDGGDADGDWTILVADTQLEIATHDIAGSLFLAFEIGQLDKLLSALIPVRSR